MITFQKFCNVCILNSVEFRPLFCTMCNSRTTSVLTAKDCRRDGSTVHTRKSSMIIFLLMLLLPGVPMRNSTDHRFLHNCSLPLGVCNHELNAEYQREQTAPWSIFPQNNRPAKWLFRDRHVKFLHYME